MLLVFLSSNILQCFLKFSHGTLKVAAAKGLVAGSFTIKRLDSTAVDGASEPEVNRLFVSTLRCQLTDLGNAYPEHQGYRKLKYYQCQVDTSN